jgi:hypothetical protein
MTDSIFDNDPSWQSLSKAVRNRSRDWIYLRVASEPRAPYRHLLPSEELQLREQLRRVGAYSMQDRSALEQYYQAEARRHQPSSGFVYNGPFGGLFGSAF